MIWVFIFKKYSKFGSVLLGHFIKHKPLLVPIYIIFALYESGLITFIPELRPKYSDISGFNGYIPEDRNKPHAQHYEGAYIFCMM